MREGGDLGELEIWRRGEDGRQGREMERSGERKAELAREKKEGELERAERGENV